MPAPADVSRTAQALLAAHPQVRVFTFTGDLGAGKTTLIKALCAVLGVRAGTASPSFAIVNEYRTEAGDPVYHFDLYRLQQAKELEAIGFTEYVDSGHYCFIEWPELATDLLPPGTVHLEVTIAEGDERIVRTVGGPT